ncbi:MAG TPA: hypothetical protein VHQ24_12780 [Lachnospiraceae bacterium]|nr:hypothetical protein [Lachnospiraceae bacterium]
MKKFIISSFVIVVICISALLVLSAPKDSNYNIHLVVDSWSDQDIDYPEQEFDFKNIELNETYVIPLEGDGIDFLREFKVVKIDDSSITISTPMPLSNKESGIDLNSTKRKFIIKAGKTTELDTLTMDAGEWYVFTLVDK